MLPILLLLAVASPVTITVKGSDTIGGELGPELARAYLAQHPDQKVTWEALGSKTAFVGLLDGSADLGAASRQVSEAEWKEAKRLGFELQEFQLGFDGVSVVVNPQNQVPGLTLAQLTDLYLGKITNWKELGGPDAKVTLLARPTYSGTRAFFDEKVLHKQPLSASAELIEANEQIVPRVSRELGAVAYVGLGSVSSATRTVPLAGTLPDAAHVRDGSYPLSRTLYLYSRGAPTGPAAALLRFALSKDGQALVAKHGFIPGGTQDSQVAASAASAASARQETLRVIFRSESTQITPLARAALRPVIEKLLADPRAQVVLVGHADSRGSAEVNRKVSLARARAVARWLSTASIDRSRVRVESQSSDAPLASNDTPEGRRKNRRVDVFVVSAP